ncbi:MAG: protein kinase [Burkholderiales bacterium]|nr:protein kinase [Burkholderiales bacterium]
MIDGYDAKSCNALQRPFYRPVEAAIRWCNLIQHEGRILQSLGEDHIPKTGQFPQWPCLQANTEKILDAILHGEIPHGRDGKTVADGDHVARARLTVRHTDLREWMVKYHPGSKPAFLFDEIERSAHAAINADSFMALQADRDAARAELEKARKWGDAIVNERDALLGERDSLRAMVDKMAVPGERAEATYLTIIGALLELVRSPRPGRDSDAAVIRELIDNYSDKPGISKTTLEAKFAEARRRLNST